MNKINFIVVFILSILLLLCLLTRQSKEHTQILKSDGNAELPDLSGNEQNSGSDVPLSEIIANQIRNKDTSCPKDDRVTYEACLLYQSTLGAWLLRDLSDSCPNIIKKHKLTKVLTPEIAQAAISKPCFAYLYAINVANVTPILISSANSNFHKSVQPDFVRPASDAEHCLLSRHGICGNQNAVALALLKRAGLVAREVQFYYQHNKTKIRLNHITPEIFIDGAWRLIDTTYGAYWLNPNNQERFELMSTDDLLRLNSSKILYNLALIPYNFYQPSAVNESFTYLTSNPALIRGGIGQIPIRVIVKAEKEVFRDIPNYIGDNRYDNKFDDISFKLLIDNLRTYKISANISASAFSNTDQVDICIDQSCQLFSKDKSRYEFTISSPSILHLKTEMDVGYVVLESLEWEEVDQQGKRIITACRS